MIDKTTIWNQTVDVINAFAPFYRDDEAGGASEYHGRSTSFTLLKAAGTATAPLTAAQVAAVTPYTADKRRRELLECALHRGLLAVDSRGRYRLTVAGRQKLMASFQGAQAAIAAAPVLADHEMETLAGLLERIVRAAEKLPLPRSKTNLLSSRWTDPGPGAPSAVRVEQYMTDLLHFRADAHIASWNAYDVDGRAWETFTLIWRNQVSTADELAAILGCCGYVEEEYDSAIRLLLNKGWIEQAAGHWQVSGSGQALRDVAEMVTNRLFFAAWQTLSDFDLQRLSELLARLCHSLLYAHPAPLHA